MNVRSRAALRIGAAALLAAGAVSMAGAPVQAADTKADLELTVAGTTLAEGTQDKIGWVKVKNNGPGTPSAMTVAVDLNGLRDERIETLPAVDGCEGGPIDSIECPVPPAKIPGPGETLEFPIITIKHPGGFDGGDTYIGFVVRSPDDTTPDNNIKQVKLEFEGEPGVDLGVLVEDVKTKFDIDGGEQQSQPPLYPGDETGVVGQVYNQGDTIAKGIELKLQLPKQVTFTEQYAGCEYSADLRTATCRDDELLMAPGEGLELPFPIKVAAGVEAPVALPKGSLSAEALGVAPANSPLARAARTTIFQKAELLGADERPTDVDLSDNVDEFAVIVAAKGGSGGGGSDDNGGLPVTGPQAGLIGGIGAGVLVAGAALFLVARRRRVVLVTPGDEKPTA